MSARRKGPEAAPSARRRKADAEGAAGVQAAAVETPPSARRRKAAGNGPAAAPPSTEPRVEASQSAESSAEASPSVETRAETAPSAETSAEASPSAETGAEAPPSAETRAEAPPSAETSAEPPPSAERAVPLTPGVRWRVLELEGFGCYAGPVSIEFPEGLGVLVADNERGKSTVVAGLMAVLYGLRGGGESEARVGPGGFSQARFQSWQGAARFRGAVELVGLDGCGWRIERSFDKHQVRLLRLLPDGPVPELTGSHNPAARRPNERYDDRLRELIGIPSREMFAATFCVTQPLPEMQEVDEDVQRLLSGAGAASYTGALQKLADDLGGLTRATGDLGVASANARKDRRLELLSAEIAEVEARLAAGREAADGLQASSRALSEAEERRATAQQSLQRTRKSLDAWQSWHRLAGRYRLQSQRRAELRRAVEQAREWAGELARLERFVHESWPRFEAAAAEDGDRLERLATLEREAASLAEQCDALRPAYEEAVRAEKTAAASLESEYADVAGRQELIRDLRELQELTPRFEELRGRVQALQDEAARLAGESGVDFGGLARPAPATISRHWHQGRDLTRLWKRLEEGRRDLDRMDDELKHYALFEDADPGLLAWIREEPLSAAELSVRKEADEQARQAREVERKALDDEVMRLDVEQADVSGLEPDALVAAEKKVALLEESQRLDWAAEQRRYQLLVKCAAMIAALLAGLFVGGALMVAMGAPPAVFALILTGLALSAGLVWWQSREAREHVATAERARTRVREQIARADRRLGPFATAPAFELGGLRQRRLDYVRRLQELQKRRAALSDDAPIAAEDAGPRDEREKRLEPFTARYGCVSIALDQYEVLRERRRKHLAELSEFSAQEWGVEPAAVASLPLARAAGAWKELGELAGVLGAALVSAPKSGADDADTVEVMVAGGGDGSVTLTAAEGGVVTRSAVGVVAPRTVGELMAWLDARSDRAWEDALVAADAWESRTTRSEDVRRKLEALGDAPEELARLRVRVDELRQRCDPFDETADLDIVTELALEAASLTQQRDEARTRRETLHPQLERVSDRLETVREEVWTLRSELAPLVGDTDASEAREQWRGYASARTRLDAARQSLDAVLAANEADSLERLAERSLAAEDGAVSLRRELESLGPDLPDADRALEADEFSGRTEALEADLPRLEALAGAAATECHEHAMRQARLQGQSPANIAAEELRLSELRDEAERVRWETEVLALAWRELRTSVDAYQSAHRERLEEAASRHFARVTASPERRVRLDDSFRVSVLDPDGTPIHPSQLSRGAQDQLYLSLRLAIADMVTGNLSLPLLLDDPFLNCDESRLQRFRETLDRMASQRQVLLFSHRPQLRGWGDAMVVS